RAGLGSRLASFRSQRRPHLYRAQFRPRGLAPADPGGRPPTRRRRHTLAHAVPALRIPPMQPPLILGGGPAGAAAAIRLAAEGMPVRLIERTTGPTDKVCGDFLSGGALRALEALGVDPPALGAAPIRTLRLIRRQAVAETTLPFPAAGLTRRVLDEALLRVASRRGAEILRGHTVRRLEPTPDGFVVPTATLGTLTATAVFLATGKHDLRGAPRPDQSGGPPGLSEPLGLKMYYALAPDQRQALRGSIELVLMTGGYAGLQLVEHDVAVLCVLLPAERFRRVEGRWDRCLEDLTAEAPHLGQRLGGAIACLDRPLAIAGIPYGHLHRAPDTA